MGSRNYGYTLGKMKIKQRGERNRKKRWAERDTVGWGW